MLKKNMLDKRQTITAVKLT